MKLYFKINIRKICVGREFRELFRICSLGCHNISLTWMTNMSLGNIILIKDIFCGKTGKKNTRGSNCAGP